MASCSDDKTIKIFNIKEKEYELLQTLNYHTNYVYKIIELKNKNLVSWSYDSSIIFYINDNNEYKKNYQISTNEKECYHIIQTKENEICFSEYKCKFINLNLEEYKGICFFDLNERKIKSSIKDINTQNFIMITNELLLIPGYDKLSIINVYQYRLVRVVDITNSGYIYGVCMLNNNMLLTGDSDKVIRQWRIEGDNLILMSIKGNVHDNGVSVLLNKGDRHIVSGSDDIKIW